MKKGHFALLLPLFAPVLGFAQASAPSGTQHFERSLQQNFNADKLITFLESSQFQLFIVLVIGIAAIIWAVYLWGSLKMAYNGLEINFIKKIWSLPTSFRIPKGIPTDPDLPHLSVWNTGRLGLAPQFVAVDNKATEDESEQTGDDAAQIRGNKPSQRG